MIVRGWALWRGEGAPSATEAVGGIVPVPSVDGGSARFGVRAQSVAGGPRAARAGTRWVPGGYEVVSGRVHRLSDGDRRPADMEGWIVPGLVDVHAHLGIASGSVPASGEQSGASARRQLHAGVLAVRDLGSPVSLDDVHARDDLPVLIRSGRHLARPKRYLRGLALEVDDPHELPDAVERQALAGDGWVKLVGDWIDRSKGADADLEPLWPADVLVDAVAAAHGNGARVAVHCFSHAAVDDLLAAGVDDIEHGSGMDADQLAAARDAGVLVTPTLLQVALFDGFARAAGRKYPAYARTMHDMWERRDDHARMLIDSGVHLLPGTDSGGYQDHGSLGAELTAWRDAGMDPARITDLASWAARDALGLPSLTDGAPADLLVLRADPATDVRALVDPAAVIRAGRVVSRTAPPAA